MRSRDGAFLNGSNLNVMTDITVENNKRQSAIHCGLRRCSGRFRNRHIQAIGMLNAITLRITSTVQVIMSAYTLLLALSG